MSKKATILIVEDDRSMLEGLRDLLELAPVGYDMQVLTAGDGVEALEVLETHRPDLIMSDVMMPRMNGYELLEQIRKKPEFMQIPFIFVTAKGEWLDIRRGKRSNADLYITKPFAINELIELISTQLSLAFKRGHSRREQVDSFKKNILQILNHEFRTPLTYVTAYYDMLADSLARAESGHTSYEEYLHGIRAGCKRLNHLVQDFVTVMELRSGELEQAFQDQSAPINNLDQLLRQLVAEKSDAAAANQVQIFYIPTQMPIVWGVDHLLRNAVERLIDNAIKFYDPQKTERTVHILTKIRSDTLEIAVQDNGLGLPAQIQGRIFDLFEQYNRGTLEQQGAGTGLTIARELVRLHHGRITVESQDGLGSTFVLSLPIHQNGSQSTRPQTQPLSRRANILIVEDDQDLLSGLADLLSIQEGFYKFNVLTADNGVEAIEVINSFLPDIIVSDIMMPQMDGYALLQTVRNNHDWLHIPFIFLTAKGEKRDEFEGFRRGVDEYLTKPYDEEDLILSINKQLNKHFYSQELLAKDFDSLKSSIIQLITPNFLTPLSSVQQESERLEEALVDVQTNEAFKQSLLAIRSGSLRLTALVEDFISLAELKTGEAETVYKLNAKEIKNPPSILYEACQILAQKYRGKAWQFDFHMSEQIPPVFGSFTILTNNIVRGTDLGIKTTRGAETKQIRFYCRTDHHTVTLHIHFSNNVPPAQLGRFQEILHDEQKELSKWSEYAPTLQILRGLTDLHNGRLQLENEDGLHISFTLPVHHSF